MAFAELDDSPMFQKQVNCIEQVADELKDRCQRLHKGCKKFMTVLEEACHGDTAFADCLEAFGGGQDDPVSMSLGGPVISRFISALRELASYKELLRSQVEHVLVERVMNFINIDLQDAKESRKRFDKAAYVYDQAREKFGSLKKNAREEIVSELEEDLQNSKSAFDRSRFNLVNGLINVDSKKKYEFLESFSAIMDAHLRYFKLGYDLLSQMEPFIHQVLTYAQQSKEVANMEQDKLAKRIQEFRTQAELDTLHASENMEDSFVADGNHVAGLNSFKTIETMMQSTGKGEILTIKQGYLVKRSSSRSEWKRRFFVLDSRGALYYYKGIKPFGSHSHNSIGSVETNSGMFGRFRSRHQKSSSFGEAKLEYHTIDLHTSTIKIDAENSDLHLCFRIISPLKTYTLQAENAVDRVDWINKIKGVTASLLHSHILQQPNPGRKQLDYIVKAGAFPNLQLFDKQSFWDEARADEANFVSQVLREVPGNDICAECGAPQPDWASLNLGMLLCIECSGVHRNLGVHVSKVRSIFLDVKVWEPTVLDLFRALGNAYCNSIWEELILQEDGRSSMKPCRTDTISQKEKYINAKYVDKVLVNIEASLSSLSNARSIWEAVKANNLRVVYRLIVASDIGLINTTYDEVHHDDQHHEVNEVDPTTCQRITSPSEPERCLQGCSILHLACHSGNPVMVELLLQFGADINVRDFHGRTPLHHCLSKGNNSLAKYLLRRGAQPSLKDAGGKSVLERVMETGAITDEELFILLTGSE